jgi:hypothetical protein
MHNFKRTITSRLPLSAAAEYIWTWSLLLRQNGGPEAQSNICKCPPLAAARRMLCDIEVLQGSGKK